MPHAAHASMPISSHSTWGRWGPQSALVGRITTFGGINKAAIETASCRASPHHLAPSKNASGDQVFVFLEGIETFDRSSALQHHNHALVAVVYRLWRQGTRGRAGRICGTGALIAVQPGDQTIKGPAASCSRVLPPTGDNCFFDRRAGGVEGILNAQLLRLAQFGFGGAPTYD